MYKILIAEDDRVHGIMLARYLNLLGHESTIVKNGREALEALDGHDLVLMDIKMPHMDGLEATKKIRGLEVAAKDDGHVPILAITAHAKEDCDECYAAGMDALLIKPVFMAALVAAINEHIPGAQQVMPDETAT